MQDLPSFPLQKRADTNVLCTMNFTYRGVDKFEFGYYCIKRRVGVCDTDHDSWRT